MQIDVNLELGADRTASCRPCSAILGTAERSFAEAVRRGRDSRDAGPGVHADPANFSDREVALRQRFCLGCLTLRSTEILRCGEDEVRGWWIGV
ncbi:hypothetical protein MUN77_15510 [Leucobacter allii]|uniref:hypothetical protein n=1 Tax=Leucobacter allii TaxID=2932247 RepID=UPI001FD0F66A|nr:hypothetical protein [Leucobacter allii]UOR01513.1 hypothetical protein MUN77_15510 [Leucobacter allii]